MIPAIKSSVAAVLFVVFASAAAAADDPPKTYCATAHSTFVEPSAPLPDELRCLVMNVYFEARKSDDDGQIAVAYVILNRAADPKYPSTICGVVYQGDDNKRGCQFSWSCDRRDHTTLARQAWNEAVQNSCRALLGEAPDPTKGALIYHATTMVPSWAGDWKRTAVIGGHVFYTRR
jgi:spore germination cell wall hydrolase CwlJ-like protein